MLPLVSSAAATLAITLAASTGVAAQVWVERFDFPAGTHVPGWTQQRGTWQVHNRRLAAVPGPDWGYITKDGFSAQNSVLDAEIRCIGSATQFGGFTSRHPGGPLDTGLLMVKVQNGIAAVFDRVFAYERGTVGNTSAGFPGAARVRCRMITLDNRFWAEVDSDLDGVYELQLAARAITQVVAPGLVGISAFGTAEIDDFEFFDAVLVPGQGSRARPGGTHSLELTTPSAQVPWLGAVARGNRGFPIDAVRRLPLDPDPFFAASLGSARLGLSGITDVRGKATLNLPIPPDPALVGSRVFASAFTFDPTMPLGVGHISNEQMIEIEP